MSSVITLLSSWKCFSGYQQVYSHISTALKCSMKFAVYLPYDINDENSMNNKTFSVVYYLSGLTCTHENVMTKGGAQKSCSENGIILVMPDTSPRGCDIEGENDSYDFGSGAGFYVDATTDKWKENYQMYTYVTVELPALIAKNFPRANEKKSIMGHSMGGHGALICFLKNPGKYISASAFSPICNPINCPWGEKAFSGYLGSDKKCWEAYDATCLVKNAKTITPILIDQGIDDEFLDNQLYPDEFVSACRDAKVAVTLRKQDGYDHSYYFISTFMEDHIKHHSGFLNN